jgi:hypothetical protein
VDATGNYALTNTTSGGALSMYNDPVLGYVLNVPVNGGNSNLNSSTALSALTSTSTWTCSHWVYVYDTTSVANTYYVSPCPTASFPFGAYTNRSGAIGAYPLLTEYYGNSFNLPRNTWLNWTIVSTGGTTADGSNYFKIIVNGIPIFGETSPRNATGTLQVGGGGGLGGFYVTNYRVYNYAMTYSQINNLYTYDWQKVPNTPTTEPFTNYLFALKFNSATIPTTDATGKTVSIYTDPVKAALTMYNDTVRGYVLNVPTGNTNSCLYSSPISFTNSSTWTFCEWIYIYDTTNTGTYYLVGQPGSNCYAGFWANNSSSYPLLTEMIGNQKVPRNTWFHYAHVSSQGTTADGTNYELILINGLPVSKQPSARIGGGTSATYSSINMGFICGTVPGNGAPTGFYVDNYKIFDYAMTIAQVNQLYSFEAANPKGV